MAVDLGGSGTNYGLSFIQRIGRADAWREGGIATDGLSGQTCPEAERQMAVQNPVILVKLRDLRIRCAQQARALKVHPFGNRAILRQQLNGMRCAGTVIVTI